MPPVVTIPNRKTLALFLLASIVLSGLMVVVASVNAQSPVDLPSAGRQSAYSTNFASSELPTAGQHGGAAPAPSPSTGIQTRPTAHSPLAARPITDQANAPHTLTTPDAAARESARNVQRSRPLPPRSTGATGGSLGSLAADGSPQPPGPLMSLTTVVSGLAIVLGLFLVVAWLFKRAMPKGAGALPSEVVEVLGRTALAPRQMVHLIRVGQKMLLVSISAAGVETLTEITDPMEVDRLAGICGQTSSQSVSSAFRHVFQQFSQESAPAGFLGDAKSETNESASRAARPEVTHG